MVAKKISSYTSQKDTNGDLIGTWAIDVGGGRAKCKACGEKSFSFAFGKKAFTQHSITEGHQKNMKKLNGTQKQLHIDEMVAGDDHEKILKKKARRFEVDLVRRLDSHNVPFTVVPCLVDCLMTNLAESDGSEIVQKIELGRSKASYIAKHGIAKTYLQETISKLQDCDGFSIGFDESEVNKEHECEVMVMLSMKETGIELRHYRTIALESTDAQTIVDTLREQMDDDLVPWRTKLLAPMTDGCNTMAGRLSGVKKRLADLVPDLKDLGSCNDHHIGNAAKKGVEDFDEDVKEVLVNVYFDLGGAKGKGLKKKKHFERLAKAKGRKVVALKKFGATRFRSYRISSSPVIRNWSCLVDYYTSVDKPTDRQVKLKIFFVDQEIYSLLRLEFIMAATVQMNDAINFFEGRTNKIHIVREKMEHVLRSQLLQFMKKESVYDYDEEENIVKKRGEELINIDVHDDNMLLNRRKVFIGQKCIELIKKLGLNPNSCQLDEFFKKVYRFHQSAAKNLQEYFSTGLKSRELDYLNAFSPFKRTHRETKERILYLANSYPKIITGIAPVNGFDLLRNELDIYTTDDILKELDKSQNFNSYWGDVANVKEGEWELFEVLPRFARALGTPFNSGSEMERGFSRQSDITRDVKRNRMTHETLDSHMQIHYGMESRETKQNCDVCVLKEKIAGKESKDLTEVEKKTGKKVCVCHCKYSEITNTMMSNCAVAWKAEIKEEDAAEEEEEPVEIGEEDEQLLKRIEKLRSSVAKRVTLYELAAMKPLYDTKEDKRRAAIARRAEKNKGKEKEVGSVDGTENSSKSSKLKTTSKEDFSKQSKEKKTSKENSSKQPKEKTTAGKASYSKEREANVLGQGRGSLVLSNGFKIPKRSTTAENISELNIDKKKRKLSHGIS